MEASSGSHPLQAYRAATTTRPPYTEPPKAGTGVGPLRRLTPFVQHLLVKTGLLTPCISSNPTPLARPSQPTIGGPSGVPLGQGRPTVTPPPPGSTTAAQHDLPIAPGAPERATGRTASDKELEQRLEALKVAEMQSRLNGLKVRGGSLTWCFRACPSRLRKWG